MKTTQIIKKETYKFFDVLGPTVAFLTPPSNADADYSVMFGTILPNVSVPLHSHPDDESFYLLSGVVQVLIQQEDNVKWVEAKAGDFIHITKDTKHAWKNTSDKPVEGVITTTARIGKFFQEVRKPVIDVKPLSPPMREELQHFMQVAAKYGHWLGSPEENAAVGISIG
jgi:quercetin dioxygenase-like cupin family protein